MPLPTKSAPQTQHEHAKPNTTPSLLTVAELILRYWNFADRYYRKPDGSPTSELDCLKAALQPLRKLYQDLPAAEFTPLKHKAVRELFIVVPLGPQAQTILEPFLATPPTPEDFVFSPARA